MPLTRVVMAVYTGARRNRAFCMQCLLTPFPPFTLVHRDHCSHVFHRVCLAGRFVFFFAPLFVPCFWFSTCAYTSSHFPRPTLSCDPRVSYDCPSERDWERERLRKRERERERERETNRLTDREKERLIEKQRDKQTKKQTDWQRERETDWETERQTDQETDWEMVNKQNNFHCDNHGKIIGHRRELF